MDNKTSLQCLSNTETAAFCSQLSMLLHSGISALEGISILKEDAHSKSEEQILTQIYDTLMTTGIFADALEAAGVFPDYMLRMVRIGEQSGRLDDVMTSLTSYYERDAAIHASIRNAVTYPVVMSVMMLVVILVLVTQVLPVFQQVFEQFGAPVSGFSLALMNIGSALGSISPVIIGVLLLLAVLLILMLKTSWGMRLIHKLAQVFPFTRRISEMTASCRFSGGMALMIASGFSMEESFSMAGALSDTPSFQQKLKKCEALVSDGESMSEAFAKAGVFSGIYARMISIGQKTGSLEDALSKVSGQYEEALDEHISSVIGKLEPTLVAVLSILTGVILLSVMLPLMGLMAGL